MGMHSEIHWQGNRDSWECSLRFIGREIGAHGMHSEIHWHGIGTHGNAF